VLGNKAFKKDCVLALKETGAFAPSLESSSAALDVTHMLDGASSMEGYVLGMRWSYRRFGKKS
jgi:hypothetical protein